MTFVSNEQPKCLGNFDKCPLMKKLFCYRRFGDNIIDKCRLICNKYKDKKLYGIYMDEFGTIWVESDRF